MSIERTIAALIVSLASATALSASAPAHAQTRFKQTNLVSDGSVPATLTDPDLVNPWGLAESPTSPFWVANNHTGLATLYSVSTDNLTVSKLGLVVTIPPAIGGPPSPPTGQVFNGGSGFVVGASPARFLFDSEDGAISGWSGGTTAAIMVDHSGIGAVYKGLAIDDANTFLFASDFHNGDIEKYDSTFTQVTGPGSFTDPNLPAGYAPFNLKVLGGELYVTYAKQDAGKMDDDPGPGNGFVDVFNLDGSLDKRLISGGALNSPWGLTIAPSSFGSFAGDLLVGNFGDGTINAFDPTTGAFVDALRGLNGQPIVITDLWALSPGNGGSGGGVDSLYFTAGLAGEAGGLFGSLTAVPEARSWAMMLSGFAALSLAAYRRRKAIGAAI